MDSPLARLIVSQIKDYVPGKSAAGAVKLSSNENPFGPSPKAVAAIIKETQKLQTYPDQKSILLREALGKKLGISDECVICGNGSDDIMQIIAATYLNPGDEVIIPEKTFSVYELVARVFDGRLVFVALKDLEIDLETIAASITEKTKLIFLTAPNNPTGAYFSASAFDVFMQKVPENILVVIDEAYVEFVAAKDFPNFLKYVKEGKNIVVLRTFSKYYGLAGLRIGYGIASKGLIAPLFRAKMPFNVNRLAQAGALAALEDKNFLEKTFANNCEEKKRLYAEFDKLGLDYKKTEANFIFINLKRPADELFLALMKKGIIIRPLTSFGFPEAIRVSIGTPEQNKKLVEGLKDLFA